MKVRDGISQFNRFLEAARKLGCDEGKEKFEAQLGKIAEHKPVAETKPAAKKEQLSKKPRRSN